jgi:hypothetical protein
MEDSRQTEELLTTLSKSIRGRDAKKELKDLHPHLLAGLGPVLNSRVEVVPGMRAADVVWLGISFLVARAVPASTVFHRSLTGVGNLRAALMARLFDSSDAKTSAGVEKQLLQAVALTTHRTGFGWHLDSPLPSENRDFVTLSRQVFLRDIAARLDPLLIPGVSISIDHQALVPCPFLDTPAPPCPHRLSSAVVIWLKGQLGFSPPGRLRDSAAALFYALAIPVGAVAAARRVGNRESSFRVLFDLHMKDSVVIEKYRTACKTNFIDALTGYGGGGEDGKAGHALRAERLWSQAVALAVFDYTLETRGFSQSQSSWRTAYVMLDHERTDYKSRLRLASNQHLGRPCQPFIVVVLSRWFVYNKPQGEWIACQDAIHALGVWVSLAHQLECGFNFRTNYRKFTSEAILNRRPSPAPPLPVLGNGEVL